MKIKKIGINILGIFVFLCLFSKIYAVETKEGTENFPSTYQPYIEQLQKNHPNWRFLALYTNLDWDYVIQKENEFGKNLVPKSYSDRWKNTTPRTI